MDIRLQWEKPNDILFMILNLFESNNVITNLFSKPGFVNNLFSTRPTIDTSIQVFLVNGYLSFPCELYPEKRSDFLASCYTQYCFFLILS